METTEDTTETTTPTPSAEDATEGADETGATEASGDAAEEPTEGSDAPEVSQDPSIIGKITPEEHTALLQIRQQSQQLLAKIGEHEVQKARLMASIEELDKTGQEHVNAISKRLGVEDGQQWFAMADGTIRLATGSPAGQNGQGGATAPPG